MLSDGVTDRFTRFVPKEQFAAMNSYDITGVGLNLSTASELEGKTDLPAQKVPILQRYSMTYTVLSTLDQSEYVHKPQRKQQQLFLLIIYGLRSLRL